MIRPLLFHMRWIVFSLISIYFPLQALFSYPIDSIAYARRIQAHLTIRDYPGAIEEAERALVLYPQAPLLYEGYIKALACLGDEKKMVQAWEIYSEKFYDKALNRELIEEMAWGVLLKASHSSSLIMRQMALMAAFFTKEGRGVTLLNQGMKDPNYAIRTIAVKLASHFRDNKLVEGIKQLFKTEKVWMVRQKVLEAIGTMKITCLKGDLEALLASNKSLAEEKTLAIASLLQLIDGVNRPEIECLASSHWSGLRQLACHAIAYFHSLRDIDQLLRLGEDSNSDVRWAAFQALGQLRPDEPKDKILEMARRHSKDFNYQVAVSATWLLTLYTPEEGKSAFLSLLYDRRPEASLLAASALSATGRYGIELALEQFRLHPHPFVRLNLALGLIGQHQALGEATHYLKQMIKNEKGKWNILKIGLFHPIVNIPSKGSDDPLTTPESNNQLLHLELLNLLAILKVPETELAIRDYLAERSWEISATAAILILTEADESAIESVRQLLQDPQSRVRLQASLILSLWSREEEAIKILEEGYLKSEWELKARILEGLGRVGSMNSVPFLIKVLKESSQTLRLIAAMSLIQCLNH